MANYNLTQTGEEVQAYIDSIPVIDVTGTLSSSNIVFATNPYTQIAANYAADCGSVIRLNVAGDVYVIRITGYDSTYYTGSVFKDNQYISVEIGESSAQGMIEDANAVALIPVTGTESGGSITLSSNPFTQVQTAVNAGQHVVVRVTYGSDIVDFTMNTYSASVATYIGTANFLQNEFQLLCSASSAVITNRSTSNTFSTGESVPNVGIDTTPTQGSGNLVTSGGVWDVSDRVDTLEANIENENVIPDADEIIINSGNEQIAKFDNNGVEVSNLKIGGEYVDIQNVNISGEKNVGTTSEEVVIFGDEESPALQVYGDKIIVKKLTNPDGFVLEFSNRETAAALRSYIANLDLSAMPITGNVIALGDSTVAGYLSGVRVMSLLSVTGTKTDLASAGATIANMQTAWSNLAQATKSAANYVFVEVGLNSLESSPLADYQNLITSIRGDSPSAKIILCAMSPAHERFYNTSTPSVAEEKYNNWRFLNTAIRNICFYGADACAWFHSIIMGDGEDNLLPQYEYTTPDHIHPNADGVKVIAWSWLTALFK